MYKKFYSCTNDILPLNTVKQVQNKNSYKQEKFGSEGYSVYIYLYPDKVNQIVFTNIWFWGTKLNYNLESPVVMSFTVRSKIQPNNTRTQY